MAYIFRQPLFEIKKWPMSEILTWKAVFDIYGPLDWEREDWRDARNHAFRYGKKGKTISDYRIFSPPEKINPSDQAIKNIREFMKAIPQDDKESIEKMESEIRRIKRENY